MRLFLLESYSSSILFQALKLCCSLDSFKMCDVLWVQFVGHHATPISTFAHASSARFDSFDCDVDHYFAVVRLERARFMSEGDVSCDDVEGETLEVFDS